MIKRLRILPAVLALLLLSACGSPQETQSLASNMEQAVPESSEAGQPAQTEAEPSEEESALNITVGDNTLSATFEDNSSAEAFRELLSQNPITIEMEDYGGFEKVGPLGATLTRCDEAITTQPGDVILYQGNQITIYYATNSWRFTRLAKINDPTNLKAVLGDGSVRVTFSLE